MPAPSSRAATVLQLECFFSKKFVKARGAYNEQSGRIAKPLRCGHLCGMGLGGLEPPTSRLSGVRSNHLSYRPAKIRDGCPFGSTLSLLSALRLTRGSRKEVIQPQVPLRLPCYDFAPVTELAFGGSLPQAGWVTDFGRSRLPWRDGRCVQGPGTYSPWCS